MGGVKEVRVMGGVKDGMGEGYGKVGVITEE